MPTTIGVLELRPGYGGISVYSNFSGDDQGQNFAVCEYRELGGGWRYGLPMVPDRRTQVPEFDGSSSINYYTNPYRNQWRGMLVRLEPDTDYEVRVTYTDPNGGGGTVSGVARTLNTEPPSNGTVRNTTPANFASTYSLAQPGDRIRVSSGSVTGTFNINRSGTQNAWITIEAADPVNPPTFNVSNEENFWLGGVHHVHFRNIRVINTRTNGRGVNFHFWNGSNNILITGVYAEHRSPSWAAANVSFDDNQDCYDIGIIDCDLVYAGGSSGEPCNIYNGWWEAPSHGITVLNTIMRGPCMDGPSGNWYKDNWFGGCWIEGGRDDLSEIEGQNICTAVYDCTLKSTAGLMGQGVAPVEIGPFYLIRSALYGADDAEVKMGNGSDGHILIYHCTMYGRRTTNGPSFFGNIPQINNVFIKNCIIDVDRYVVEDYNSDVAWSRNFVDYNLLRSSQGSKIKWLNVQYTSLSAWRSATGQGAHDVSAGQSNGPDPRFVNPGAGDFNLQADSPAIDAGEIILGINDQTSPWPYRGAGPDIGVYEFDNGTPPPVQEYTLTIQQAGSGSVIPAPGSYLYQVDSLAELQAQPNAGWKFDGWFENGALLSVNASYQVLMTRDVIIEARFSDIPQQLDLHTLTITIDGEGIINPLPGFHSYEEEQRVEIQATPSPGYRFARWLEGAVVWDQNPTIIVMASDRAITGVFVPVVQQRTLILSVMGEGALVPSVGQHVYLQDTVVNLGSIPAPGWEFREWREGTLQFSELPAISIIMSANRSIAGVFTEIEIPVNQHSLTITVIGPGSTNPIPATYVHPEGLEVSIQAGPVAGARFLYFKEAEQIYPDNPLTVRMDFDRAIVAYFEDLEPSLEMWNLNLSVMGDGRTFPVIGPHQYEDGVSVPVVAVPDPGNVFVEWLADGAHYSFDEVVAILMDGDHSLQAVYEAVTVPPDQVVISVLSMGGGFTDPAGVMQVDQGTFLRLEATAGDGWEFNHWEGSLTGEEPILEFNAAYHMTLIAVFNEKSGSIAPVIIIMGGAFLSALLGSIRR